MCGCALVFCYKIGSNPKRVFIWAFINKAINYLLQLLCFFTLFVRPKNSFYWLAYSALVNCNKYTSENFSFVCVRQPPLPSLSLSLSISLSFFLSLFKSLPNRGPVIVMGQAKLCRKFFETSVPKFFLKKHILCLSRNKTCLFIYEDGKVW